jgi:Prophage minor tail protein Z (GPZ)
MIEFESKSIQKAIADIKKQYGQLSPDKLNTAISRALNHTAAKGRTEASQNIRKSYNIAAARINNEITVRRASGRTLTAYITAKGSPLSLNTFQAKQIGSRGTTTFDRKGVASSRLNRKSRNNAAKGVSVAIQKGKTKNIPTAFIQFANGGITVFARGKYKSKGEGFEFGSERMPIGKITSTSIPLMFANNSVMTPTTNLVETELSARMIKEINWILGR